MRRPASAEQGRRVRGAWPNESDQDDHEVNRSAADLGKAVRTVRISSSDNLREWDLRSTKTDS